MPLRHRTSIGLLLLAGALAAHGDDGRDCSKDRGERFSKHHVSADKVPNGRIDYAIALPCGYDAAIAGRGGYPLIVFLHGGGGSADQLQGYTARIDAAVQARTLPPAIWSTPSAGRSFYMDYRDGTEMWERAIMAAYLPKITRDFGIDDPRQIVVAGISMGGMGSLRLAFKHPDRFGAVAAMEPAIEAALRWSDVATIDKFYRADQYTVKFGNPGVDTAYWEANHPTTIAAANPRSLDQLGIYLEVGDVDVLRLYRGAEFLHRVLFDLDVAHEYRLVRGADHIGDAHRARRFDDVLDFIGRHFDPVEEDAATQALIEQLDSSFDGGRGLPLPSHR